MILVRAAAGRSTRSAAGKMCEPKGSESKARKEGLQVMVVEDAGDMVRGFKAGAAAAGIKKRGGLDLAIIFSEKEAVGAGVFTTNKVKAAPVLVSQENVRNGRVRVIVANSGNANACTGREGLANSKRMAELVAQELGIDPTEVLVASTGVIGAQLDIDLISRSLKSLVQDLSPEGIPRALEAIMTTDSFPKMARYEGKAGGMPYRIVGIAKGAGMIMPQMATMLCFILTDVQIGAVELKKALSSGVERTFNRITVDGDTSTNDTVLVMANGMAGNGRMDSRDYESFGKGLTDVMGRLAAMIVKDGEGATKVIEIRIQGAASGADAVTAAKTVANSTLVKTAFYGQDPNWGRIMAALGRSGITMREEDVGIWVDDVKIVDSGVGTGLDREKDAAERMKQKQFSVTIELNQGEHDDRVITCDLTHDYVTINAEYRT
jgi:glutamate N-acetyltransferase/amino-acid N-acetyltransferase